MLYAKPGAVSRGSLQTAVTQRRARPQPVAASLQPPCRLPSRVSTRAFARSGAWDDDEDDDEENDDGTTSYSSWGEERNLKLAHQASALTQAQDEYVVHDDAVPDSFQFDALQRSA